MHRGPPVGTKYADFITMFEFLAKFVKGPLNYHKIEHEQPYFGDSKKIYRYIDYGIALNLLEVAKLDVTSPRFPGRRIVYYQLTEDGKQLLTLAKKLRVLRVFVSPEFYVNKPEKKKPWTIEIE